MAEPLDVADVFGDNYDHTYEAGTDHPARRGAKPAPKPAALPAAIPLPGRPPKPRIRKIDPAHLEHGIPRLTAEPGILSAPEIFAIDPRGTAYPSITDPTNHYTTTTLARLLKISDNTVVRWCKRWFGRLPPGRGTAKGTGYCIPREYLYVSRAWLQVENDAKLREQVRWALIRQLREWVVVCGVLESTHHTHNEVLSRLQALQTSTTLARALTTILHVGPILPEDVDLTQ